MAEETGRPDPSPSAGLPAGGSGPPAADVGRGAGVSPAGIPLSAFVAAVGRSVATAAQELRAMPVPSGAPGVELRAASLTIKGRVSWDSAGMPQVLPAAPGDAETAVSQLVLSYEPVPRLPPGGAAGTR